MRTNNSADEAKPTSYLDSTSFYRLLFIATTIAILFNVIKLSWVWAGYWTIFLILQITVKTKFRGHQFISWLLGGILVALVIYKIVNFLNLFLM
jgi:hypothetical protein